MLLNPEYLLQVLLVFVRIGGVLVAAPFFSQRFIPVQVKVLLSVLLAFSLTGLVVGPLPPHVMHPLGFTLAVMVEALTGVLLGFAAQFVFFVVQFAGDVIGFQMSLSMAQVYNPISGEQSNPIGQFLTLGVMLLFVLLDGPQHILIALATSFEAVPLGGANIAAGGPLLLQWTGAFFAAALRLAAPFMVALLLIDVALGVFARMVPQADLFSLSLPIKLFVGIAVFALFLPQIGPIVPDFVRQVIADLSHMIEALAG